MASLEELKAIKASRGTTAMAEVPATAETSRADKIQALKQKLGSTTSQAESMAEVATAQKQTSSTRGDITKKADLNSIGNMLGLPVTDLKTGGEEFKAALQANQGDGGTVLGGLGAVGKTFGTAAINLPQSTGKLIAGIGSAIWNIDETASTIGQLGAGLIEKLIPGEQRDEKLVNAVGDMLTERYGSVDKLIKTFEEDPAGLAADVAGILGGAGGVIKGAGKLSGLESVANVGSKVGAASSLIDPLTGLTKATGAITSKVTGLASEVFPSSRLAKTLDKIETVKTKSQKAVIEFLQPDKEKLTSALKDGRVPDVIEVFANDPIPAKNRAELNTALTERVNDIADTRNSLLKANDKVVESNDWLNNAKEYLSKKRRDVTTKNVDHEAINKLEDKILELEGSEIKYYNDGDKNSLQGIKEQAQGKAYEIKKNTKFGSTGKENIEREFWDNIGSGAKKQIETLDPNIESLNRQYAANQMAKEFNANLEAIRLGTATPTSLQKFGRAVASYFLGATTSGAFESVKLLQAATANNIKGTLVKLAKMARKQEALNTKAVNLVNKGVTPSSGNIKNIIDKGVANTVTEAARVKARTE